MALMVALPGCGAYQRAQARAAGQAAAAAVFPAGSSAHTISVGPLTRSFIVYRPAVLPAAAPLVVMLHGGFGTASGAEAAYHWDAQANTGHFVVAYPDGYYRAWNTGGGCCGIPAKLHVNDIAFITAMVAAIERAVPINADRVYATGISNGGIMAYTLACHTTIFAAIGPVAATELGTCRHPAPVSVIHIHGTADTNIPYNGGPGTGVAHIDGPPVPAVNARWRAIDRCGPAVKATAGTVTTSIANCTASKTAELITIAGAGHQWPGATPDPITQRLLHLDPPSRALNATRVIWQFFATHTRHRAT